MVQDVKEVLKSAGIRPSYQRVQILKTLRATDKHPTAEELLKMVNSASDVEISRATLYNTLQLLLTMASLCRWIQTLTKLITSQT